MNSNHCQRGSTYMVAQLYKCRVIRGGSGGKKIKSMSVKDYLHYKKTRQHRLRHRLYLHQNQTP